MKNLTIISVLLLFLGIGCTQPIELQKCDVELNLTFTDIERVITVTLEFTDCSMETVSKYVYLNRTKTVAYIKRGYIGNQVIANDVNYFTIESIKPHTK